MSKMKFLKEMSKMKCLKWNVLAKCLIWYAQKWKLINSRNDKVTKLHKLAAQNYMTIMKCHILNDRYKNDKNYMTTFIWQKWNAAYDMT